MATPKTPPKAKPVDKSTQGADMKQRINALNKAGQSYRTGKPISTKASPSAAAQSPSKRPTPMPLRPLPNMGVDRTPKLKDDISTPRRIGVDRTPKLRDDISTPRSNFTPGANRSTKASPNENGTTAAIVARRMTDKVDKAKTGEDISKLRSTMAQRKPKSATTKAGRPSLPTKMSAPGDLSAKKLQTTMNTKTGRPTPTKMSAPGDLSAKRVINDSRNRLAPAAMRKGTTP